MVKNDLSAGEKVNRRPLIIAHRGASSHAPENTLAAFRAAIEAGANGVEFDVQLAKDGVPVVIHDTDLGRTAGIDKRVGEMTSVELSQIDVGSWFARQFNRETVPTLAQVLSLLEEVSHECTNDLNAIYIELKCELDNFKPLAAAVCDMIRDSKLLPQIIVQSFRLAVIPEVRCLLPEVQTAALFEPSILTILRRRQDIITMTREFGAHQISLHYILATPKLCALAADANLPVTVWTVDGWKWVKRAERRGINAIITNDPEKLDRAGRT
jgi:glycerophosphoryl diester phosphodiesterase